MKSLKQICEDNITHPLYEVSILADIDDQIDAYDNSIIERIEKWIKENYDCTGLKILNNPNNNELYEVTAQSAKVKNRNTISLTNGMFEWKEVNDFFVCSRCSNLKSLAGAPKKVGEDFNCYDCTSLNSLEGAPKKVGGHFDCCGCKNLSSLEGAPEKVGGDFNCAFCSSLTSLVGAPKIVRKNFNCYQCITLESLEGAPKEVGGDFFCYNCTSLTSLKGAPKKVGGNFYCNKCKTEFTEDDVKKVSDVKGKIVVK